MNKIILLEPAHSLSTPIEFFSSKFQQLGLRYIQSFLLMHNIECDLMDLNFENESDLLEKISSYDFVGIYTLWLTLDKFKHLSNSIKSANNQITVIAGGPDASARPHVYLQNNYADIVVLGEGEETCLDLLTNSNIENIEGIAYLKEGRIVKTPSRKRIANLDDFPFPERGEFTTRYRAGFLDSKYPSSMPILSSRGCAYSCKYCDKTIFGNKVTFRSVENIIEEIEYLINRYNINSFCFIDDVFILKKDRAIKFCQSIIRKKIAIKWKCMGMIGLVDNDLLSIMREAGFYRIEYGIESGCVEVLKSMNRNMTLQQIAETVKVTRKAGIEITANFILGFPDETEEQKQKTIILIHNLKIDSLLLSQFVRYPGLDSFHTSIKQNKLENINRHNYKNPIGRLILFTNIKFYLKPNKIVQLLVFSIRVFLYKVSWLKKDEK